MVRIAKAKSIRVIVVTQPSMFREDLPAAMKALLWTGGVGDYQLGPGAPYYSVAALARGMAEYNRVSLEQCRELGVECVDLASQLTQDTSTLYDDVHFNERGSREVAQTLARLIPRDPVS
jgi:hypothetical protein